MGMTITEKILAAHAGRSRVVPGELIQARIDLALANDITAPMAIGEFDKIGANRVFDRHRIALIPDHFAPNKDIRSAEQAGIMRRFARRHEITHYYEVGRMGIEHCLLPQEGLVLPGDLIIGADSHTCTYGALGAFATGVGSTDLAAALATGETWLRVPETMRVVVKGTERRRWVGGKDIILYIISKIGVDGALYRAVEFAGEAIAALTMEGRLTMANMAIEAGAKNGIFIPDEKTGDYVKGRARRPYKCYDSDKGARYSEVLEFDIGDIEPQVAFPHLPENSRPISEAGTVRIDQAVIGSCTNGWIEDLRLAAAILRGKKVHPDVRLIVIPGTQEIYRQALKEGLIEIFIEAGAAVSTPTCGPCLGGHMGILARGERAVSTTNRNFAGRMGHPESEIYLSGPAIAAASAILGRLGGPEEVA